jgi:excisionase family DNA binding protein
MRLLSVPAVAEILDVDRRTVYRFIASGELPVVDLRTGPGRSRVRIPATEVDAFIGRRTASQRGQSLQMRAGRPLSLSNKG